MTTLVNFESKNVDDLTHNLSLKNESHNALIFLKKPLVKSYKLRRSILFFYILLGKPNDIAKSKTGNLSDLLRDFKKFTAKNILENMHTKPESRGEWVLERFKRATESHGRNKNYQLWQYGNHAEEIYSHKFMLPKLDYIYLNPVKAGIVQKHPITPTLVLATIYVTRVY